MQTALQQVRPTDPDAISLERARVGDPRGFEEIVARHKRIVYCAARRLLGTHEDADEAAQQAFVRAWRSLGGFRGDCSVRSWLVRIVLNVAKSMRSSGRPLDPLEGKESLADPRADSEEAVRLGQLRQQVRRAVDGLPPRQREVVVLKVLSEMTHREVAEIMGLSEGAVKAHLHQAVANLRRLLKDGEARRIDR